MLLVPSGVNLKIESPPRSDTKRLPLSSNARPLGAVAAESAALKGTAIAAKQTTVRTIRNRIALVKDTNCMSC